MKLAIVQILFLAFAAKADIVVDYLDHLSELHGKDLKANYTASCECTAKMTACGLDSMCRSNLECDMGCAGDVKCQLACTYSYMSPTLDDLDHCLFVDPGCWDLPKPSPLNNATCREPTTTVADIDAELLGGTWYVVKGFNPLYDCFDC